MYKSIHEAGWDQMRMRHGITLRVLEQVPTDKLASHPIAGMRTPIELVVHMYASVRLFPQSVLDGKLSEYDDAPEAKGIQTREQLVAYVKKAWAAADAAAHKVTEAQLAGIVTTPWGEFPGAGMFGILYAEHLHHRGQLYAFLRTFGIEPVMMWDFDHNAAEFQPRAHAQG